MMKKSFNYPLVTVNIDFISIRISKHFLSIEGKEINRGKVFIIISCLPASILKQWIQGKCPWNCWSNWAKKKKNETRPQILKKIG